MRFSTHPLGFFDLSSSEIMLIMFLVLLFFGGEKLPGFARGLGKALREFKRASSGVEDEIRRAMAEPPPAKPENILPPAALIPEPSAEATPVEITPPTSEIVPPVETVVAPATGSPDHDSSATPSPVVPLDKLGKPHDGL